MQLGEIDFAERSSEEIMAVAYVNMSKNR